MSFSLSHRLFVILCAVFVTALVVADIIGSKLILVGGVVFSAGIIPFPLTFVLTDLINEFYGKDGARFVTFLGLGMAIFCALLLWLARVIPAADHSPIPFDTFNMVFGLSGRMFLASLTAYVFGQLLDIQVFFVLRRLTHEKFLWLRATGSTVISQLVDSFVVTMIAFSGKLPLPEILQVASNNYTYKFFIALGLTPVCYLGHALIGRLLSSHLPGYSSHEHQI